MEGMAASHTLFYDGVCGMCDRFTQVVLRRDTEDRFRFAPLQSEYAQRVLLEHGVTLDGAGDTVFVLTADGRLLERSTAVLFTLGALPGFSVLAFLGGLVPRFVRDFFYGVVAKRRYRIFGKAEACRIPSPHERAKFIGDSSC